MLPPVLSGPGDRWALMVSTIGPTVKESAALISITSHGLLVVSGVVSSLVVVVFSSAPRSSHIFRTVVAVLAKWETGGCRVIATAAN